MEKSLNAQAFSVPHTKENTSVFQKLVLRLLSSMTKGCLRLTLPNGDVKIFGSDDKTLSANITVKNEAFFRRVVLYGDIGFGEAFVEGDWDTDNITNVISWMILNINTNPVLSGSSSRFSPLNFLKIINKAAHLLRSNSKTGSKDNISRHYDLNNDFFKLWLDETMTYSSGIELDKSHSLYEAQLRKYDRLCQMLKIKKGDRVLEIGTGWGGFSIYAAETYGCDVTSVTISAEQYKYASGLVREKYLEHRVHIYLKDYREITGIYDKIVSIEMLEAVGHAFLPKYFSQINKLLAPDGAAGFQVITSHDANYGQLRKGVDWIQKHVFPGSLLPSVGAINTAVNKTGNLHLHDLKNFGLDYALTLRAWREKFNSELENVFKLNFDNAFVRKWNYYLSYCEAAFAMRNISVVQMIYTRPNNRNL